MKILSGVLACCFLCCSLWGCQPLVAKETAPRSSVDQATEEALARYETLVGTVRSESAEADAPSGLISSKDDEIAALRETVANFQARLEQVAQEEKREEELKLKAEADATSYRQSVLAEIAQYRGPIWQLNGGSTDTATLARHVAEEHGIEVPAGLTRDQLVKLHSIAHQREKGAMTSTPRTRAPQQQAQVYRQQCPTGGCPNQTYRYYYRR